MNMTARVQLRHEPVLDQSRLPRNRSELWRRFAPGSVAMRWFDRGAITRAGGPTRLVMSRACVCFAPRPNSVTPSAELPFWTISHWPSCSRIPMRRHGHRRPGPNLSSTGSSTLPSTTTPTASKRQLALAIAVLPPTEVVNGVLGPMLREVGNRWHSGRVLHRPGAPGQRRRATHGGLGEPDLRAG